MNMTNKLNECPVLFDARAHTYQLGEKYLSGVTAIVNWLFPYDPTIPDRVLQLAADRGTAIHNACALWDDARIVDDEHRNEVVEYQTLCDKAGLKYFVSEYLVSDLEGYASSIDKVYFPDGDEYPLADIKTSSQFYVEKVTLQLSIYAYLFELQNPTKKAGKLYGIWLPKPEYGKPNIFEVQRIPKNFVLDIMESYELGFSRDWSKRIVSEYCQLPTAQNEKLPANLKEMEEEIARIEVSVKEMEARSKELKQGLLKLMQENNVVKWEGEKVVFTRKKGSTSMVVDSTKLKNTYPNIYAECSKERVTNESLTIKVK